MKNSLRVMGVGLLSILLAVFQFSCEDSGGTVWESLLDGQIEYTGTFPAIAPVTYTTNEGEIITFNYAYPGFLTLITDPSAPLSTVSNAVEANGGNIVDAIPKAGLYIVQVEQGQEAAVLSAIYDYSWLRNGSPLFPITIGARLVAIDFFVPDGKLSTPCGSEHGQHVADIMERSGNTVREVDVCGWLQCQEAPPVEVIARLLVGEMESAHAAREQVVINISLMAGANNTKSSTSVGCSSIDCKAIRKSQLIWLIALFQAVDEQEQDIADNTAITIIAGNAGVELDNQLQALQDQYKKASKRIKIVGGLTTSGEIDYDYNSSKSNMVFAMANEVDALGHSCKGTSFASPEVARILGYIWGQVPGLTSEQLMTALDNALGADPKIPQDPATGWATQDFLDRTVIEAETIGGTGNNNDNAWLGISVSPYGGGSVTGPRINCPGDCTEIYPMDTTFTLTPSPADGFYFMGWTGVNCGRGPCPITMDADKAIVAKFSNMLTWDFTVSWLSSYSSGSCNHVVTLPLNGGSSVSTPCGEANIIFTTTRNTVSVSYFGNTSGDVSNMSYNCTGSGGASGVIQETQDGFSGGGAISGLSNCTITNTNTGDVTTESLTVTGLLTAYAPKELP